MSKINVSKIEDTSGNILTLPESVTDGFVQLDSSGTLTTTANAPSEMYHKTLLDVAEDGTNINTVSWTIPDFVKESDGPVKIIITGYGSYTNTCLRIKQNGSYVSFYHNLLRYSPSQGGINTSETTSIPYINTGNSSSGNNTGYNIPYYIRFMFECKYIPAAVNNGVGLLSSTGVGAYRASTAESYQNICYQNLLASNLTSGDLDELIIYSSGFFQEGFVKVFLFKEN